MATNSSLVNIQVNIPHRHAQEEYFAVRTTLQCMLERGGVSVVPGDGHIRFDDNLTSGLRVHLPEAVRKWSVADPRSRTGISFCLDLPMQLVKESVLTENGVPSTPDRFLRRLPGEMQGKWLRVRDHIQCEVMPRQFNMDAFVGERLLSRDSRLEQAYEPDKTPACIWGWYALLDNHPKITPRSSATVEEVRVRISEYYDRTFDMLRRKHCSLADSLLRLIHVPYWPREFVTSVSNPTPQMGAKRMDYWFATGK